MHLWTWRYVYDTVEGTKVTELHGDHNLTCMQWHPRSYLSRCTGGLSFLFSYIEECPMSTLFIISGMLSVYPDIIKLDLFNPE